MPSNNLLDSAIQMLSAKLDRAEHAVRDPANTVFGRALVQHSLKPQLVKRKPKRKPGQPAGWVPRGQTVPEKSLSDLSPAEIKLACRQVSELLNSSFGAGSWAYDIAHENLEAVKSVAATTSNPFIAINGVCDRMHESARRLLVIRIERILTGKAESSESERKMIKRMLGIHIKAKPISELRLNREEKAEPTMENPRALKNASGSGHIAERITVGRGAYWHGVKSRAAQ